MTECPLCGPALPPAQRGLPHARRELSRRRTHRSNERVDGPSAGTPLLSTTFVRAPHSSGHACGQGAITSSASYHVSDRPSGSGGGVRADHRIVSGTPSSDRSRDNRRLVSRTRTFPSAKGTVKANMDFVGDTEDMSHSGTAESHTSTAEMPPTGSCVHANPLTHKRFCLIYSLAFPLL